MNTGDVVGARIITLASARKLYPHAHCLRGGGPAFVVAGTRGSDKITVKNERFRVLGLGGRDRITVQGGASTCVDGGAGNDTAVFAGVKSDAAWPAAMLLSPGRSRMRISLLDGMAMRFSAFRRLKVRLTVSIVRPR